MPNTPPQPLTSVAVQRLKVVRRRFDEAAQRHPEFWAQGTDPKSRNDECCFYSVDGTGGKFAIREWNALAEQVMAILLGRTQLPPKTFHIDLPDTEFFAWVFGQLPASLRPVQIETTDEQEADGVSVRRLVSTVELPSVVDLEGNAFHMAALAIDLYLAGHSEEPARGDRGLLPIESLGDRNYRVGDRVQVVEASEDAVLAAFARRADKSPKWLALNQNQLRNYSHYHTAPRILRALQAKYDGLFASAIQCPSKKGQGGLKIYMQKPAKTPRK